MAMTKQRRSLYSDLGDTRNAISGNNSFPTGKRRIVLSLSLFMSRASHSLDYGGKRATSGNESMNYGEGRLTQGPGCITAGGCIWLTFFAKDHKKHTSRKFFKKTFKISSIRTVYIFF